MITLAPTVEKKKKGKEKKDREYVYRVKVTYKRNAQHGCVKNPY